MSHHYLLSNTIVVLGMHRSGTSVVTKAVESVGAFLGQDLMTASPDNPKGYFEDIEVNKLNDNLLSQLGSSWYSLYLPSIESILNQENLGVALNILEGKFSGKKLWAIKDPRVTRLIPFWSMVFEKFNAEPVYVLASRHPLDVASSLRKRDGFPMNIALLLWMIHQAEALEVVLDKGGLVVNYDSVLISPKGELERLCSFLKGKNIDSKISSDDFSDDFVDSDLRHSQAQFGTGEKNDIHMLSKEFYDLLCVWGALDHLPSQDLIVSSKELLERIKIMFTSNRDILRIVDEDFDDIVKFNSFLIERGNELAESNKKLRKYESELRWIKGKAIYRVFEKGRSILSVSRE